MTSGAVTPRLSAYDEASRSAAEAVRNSAEYLSRARAERRREAVAMVRAELRRRAPARSWGPVDRMLLLGAAVALVCAALALIVSSMGLFA
jgi:hypothetical protein